MANEKILVVDDSPTIVDLVKSALEGAGFRVVTATDGLQALDQTVKERPDLILLDVEMPKLNGYEVCKRIKANPNPKIAKIPVIMLTVKGEETDKMWGLGMGADLYLTKPFDPEQIVAVVKERLK